MSLGILLVAIFTIQPRAMSYFGLNLMLQYAVPIALATIAQMCIITVNDLDLSIGPFVGLAACIGATYLYTQPILGVLALAACIVAYGALGALIQWRNLPSIVVTLGMSFVWLGIAVLVLPTPGGKAPAFLKGIMSFKIQYQMFDPVPNVRLPCDPAVSGDCGYYHRVGGAFRTDAFQLRRGAARCRRQS